MTKNVCNLSMLSELFAMQSAKNKFDFRLQAMNIHSAKSFSYFDFIFGTHTHTKHLCRYRHSISLKRRASASASAYVSSKEHNACFRFCFFFFLSKNIHREKATSNNNKKNHTENYDICAHMQIIVRIFEKCKLHLMRFDKMISRIFDTANIKHKTTTPRIHETAKTLLNARTK